MSRHVPYVAAAAVTVAVGALTTAVWAATGPVHAPVVLQASPPRPVAQPGPSPAPNLANTPGFAPSPVAPPVPGTFATGNVAQIVGAPGSPGGAQAPGLAQASSYTQPGMNQAGQPPFGEMLYSMQTYMNQPGAPDFYTTYNPTLVQANEGTTPTAAYPNPTTPQTGVPSAAAAAAGSALTQGGNSVGFYNGFGPGQANFGFYAGLTTPR